MKVKLTPLAIRKDKTDRECVNDIGGTIAACLNAVPDAATVQRAVQWWAQNKSAWAAFEKQFSNGGKKKAK